MKRKSVRLAVAVLVLLAAAYAAVDLFLGSIVKAGVNRFAPQVMHTDVKLAGAHLSPFTGGGTLTGLYVGNPRGWGSGPAFYLGRIHLRVRPSSLFGNPIVIDEIEIEKPQFTYETRFISSNIGDLLKNIQGSSGEAPARSAGGRPLTFEVRHFRVSGGLVRLGIGPAALPLPMPPLSLDNIGVAEGGITADQLAFAIMRSLTGGVISATTQAAGKVGATMGAAAGSAVKDAGAGLKGLFGGHSP